MKNAKMFAVACAAITPFLAAAQSTPTNSTTSGAPVTVVNSSSNPVPVTGSVTGTVTGNVTVSNSASQPVPVTASGTPYVNTVVDHVNSSTGHCGSGECNVYFPAVPQGKRLVIKHVSGRFVDPAKTMFAAQLLVPLIPAGSYSAQVFLPLPQVVPPNSNLFAYWSLVSQPVEVYVEAGQTPVFGAELDSGSGFVTATLTGYLVDVP